MIEWWEQNWQWSVGAGIGVLGILMGIAIALWQRRPKLLDYRVVSNIPVVASRTGGLKDKLEVRYGGHQLSDPHIATIRITNTGKAAVRVEDYESPISINYDNETSRQLDGFVVAVSNPEVRPKIKVAIDEALGYIAVRPGLLNPREWFSVQIVSEGHSGNIEVETRFADQSRPMRESELYESLNRAVLIAGPIALTIASATSALLAENSDSGLGFVDNVAVLFVSIGAFVAFWLALRLSRRKAMNLDHD